MEGSEKKSEESVPTENSKKEIDTKKRNDAEFVVDLTTPKKDMEGSVAVDTSSSTERAKREASSPPPQLENESSKNHSLPLTGANTVNEEMNTQLQLSRTPGLDAAQPAALKKTMMAGNNDDTPQTKHSDRQTVDANTEIPEASYSVPAESQEKADVTIAQPELPYFSVRRVTGFFKPNNNVVSTQQGLEQSTPQSSSAEIHASSETQQPNELAPPPPASTRKVWVTGRKTIAAKSSSSFVDYSPPHDLEGSYAQPQSRGQGRSEQAPCPAEKMTRFGAGAARPVNTLGVQGTQSQAKSTRTHSSAIPKSKAINYNAHDFDERPSKRQRTEGSHAGSSRNSPLEIEGSQSKSIIAPSEISSSQDSLTLVGSKRARGPEVAMVSTSTEYRLVEVLVQDQKQKPRRPNKRQCTGITGISTNSSVSSRAPSYDLIEDPIQNPSPQPPVQLWTGTARKPSQPQARNGLKTSGESVGTSRYFSGPPKSKPLALSSLRASGVGDSRVQSLSSDDSMDELSKDQPKVPSKEEGARLAGDNSLYETSKKPAQNNIQRTDFKSTRANPKSKTSTKLSKSRKTAILHQSYDLSDFIVGSSHWELGKDSQKVQLVPDCPQGSEDIVFNPHDGEFSMATLERELVINPQNVILIVYSTDSQKLLIRRRIWDNQKTTFLYITLAENHEPKSFVTMLSELNGSIKIEVKTRDALDQMYDKSINDARTFQARKPADVEHMEVRKQQRVLQSQQANTSFSTTNHSSKTLKPSVFYKFKHESPLALTNEEVQGRPRRSTRTSTQTQSLLWEDEKKRKTPSPPPPSWTSKFPDWEKRWGPKKTPLNYPSDGKNKAEVNMQDIERLDEGEFLNDNLIAFYLRYVQETLGKEETPEFVEKTHFFNSFFYLSLTTLPNRKPGFNYDAIKRWTAKFDFFGKEFIVVPINEASHWYLAIIHNVPALKKLKADTPPRETNIPPPAHEDERASEPVREDCEEVRVLDSVEGDSRSTSAQSNERAEVKGDADIMQLGGMTIEDNIKPHDSSGEQDQDVSHEVSPSEESHSGEENREIADSQPSSPKQNSPGAPPSQPVMDHSPRASPDDSPELAITKVKPEPKTLRSNKAPNDSKPPLVLDDTDKVTIIILDSLGIQHRQTVTHLRNWLIAEADTKLGIKIDKSSFKATYPTSKLIPHQDNHCDCGVFLLAYTEYFLRNSASFVHLLLEGKMILRDWESLNASTMRWRIRELLFEEKWKEAGQKEPSPGKSSEPPLKGKSKKLESSSREASDLPSRSVCPDPNSPSEQLLHDQSCPTSSGSTNPPRKRKPSKIDLSMPGAKEAGKRSTSAGSMNANISKRRKSSMIDVDKQDVTYVSTAAVTDTKKYMKSERTKSPAKGQAKAKPVLPQIKTSSPNITSPSKTSRASSISLESAPHFPSPRENSLGLIQGSGKNTSIDLDGTSDQVSSSSTMTASELVDIKSMLNQKANKVKVIVPASPSKNVRDSKIVSRSPSKSFERGPSIHEVGNPAKGSKSEITISGIENISKSRQVTNSQKGDNSQEVMLLDEDVHDDDHDDFLSEPKDPGALTDCPPPRADPTDFNGTMSPTKSSKAESNNSTQVGQAGPAQRGRPRKQKQKTYAANRGPQRPGTPPKNSHIIIVD